jgi:putative FmdB family regulatory protein
METVLRGRMKAWMSPACRRGEGGVMVTYEFRCKKCGTGFEVSCHMDEREAKAVCPKCGSRKVEQKLTGAFSSPPPAKW